MSSLDGINTDIVAFPMTSNLQGQGNNKNNRFRDTSMNSSSPNNAGAPTFNELKSQNRLQKTNASSGAQPPAASQSLNGGNQANQIN